MSVPKLMLVSGLLLLAFAVLGFFGNFFRWQHAIETNAKIISAKEQWTRRAPGNINVELEYSVQGRIHRGRASVGASRLEAASGDSLNVYYMEDDPDQMVPVDVLKSKQRFVIIAAALGTLLTVLGVAFKRRQDPSAAAAPTPASP
jgi:hypothetical protein